VVGWMEKHIPGFCVELDLDPGLFTGMLSESPEHTLGQTVVRKGRGTGWGTENTIKLGELDPILFSELVRDLQGVVS
jgi:hypothetical protein